MPYDPREFFDAGFAKFLKQEPDLIVSGVSERSLCARQSTMILGGSAIRADA